MALSTGQINDAFQQGVGRLPTGQELQTYSGRTDLEGSSGQQSLIGELSGGSSGGGSGVGLGGNVQDYLNQYHDVVLKAAQTLNSPQQTDDQLYSSVQSRIQPSEPLPTAPNLVDTFNTLRADQGTQELETNLASLKQQQMATQDQLRATQQSEEGKAVPLNVIQGRQSEEQRQAGVQLDYITRQISSATDQLQMRYNTIDTIMKYTQQDYTNALQSYDEELKQNMSVYDAFQKEKQFNYQQQQDAAQTVMKGTEFMANFALQQADMMQKAATANLQVYANLISSGNMNLNSMSSDQKLQIQKLEVQSGLGVGFTQNLVSSYPNGKVIYAGANGIVLQGSDGQLKAVSMSSLGLQGGSGSVVAGNKQYVANATSEMNAKLSSIANSYGDISPQNWKTALNSWVNAKDSNGNSLGLTKDMFIQNFGQYTDTNRGDFVSAYGFENPDKSKQPSKPKTSTSGLKLSL